MQLRMISSIAKIKELQLTSGDSPIYLHALRHITYPQADFCLICYEPIHELIQ